MKGKLLVLILMALFGSAAVAQNKPNFTGTWQLDVLRSRLDPKSDVKSATMKIDLADPKLKIEMNVQTGRGPRAHVFELQTDGTESEQTIDGRTCKAAARWGTITGERLRLEITCSGGAAPMVTTREMKLGDKGKMLTTMLIEKDEHGQRRSNEFFIRDDGKKP